jgi:hypothetical protein
VVIARTEEEARQQISKMWAEFPYPSAPSEISDKEAAEFLDPTMSTCERAPVEGPVRVVLGSFMAA